MKESKMKKMEFVAFAALAGSAINGILMAKGIETMPGLWTPEVYQDPGLGLSIGGITGISLGAVAGASALMAKEAVVGTIGALRERFLDNKSDNNLKPKM
jgi:hypothetical protein